MGGTTKQVSRFELRAALLLIALQLVLHFFVLDGLRSNRDLLLRRASDAADRQLDDASYVLGAEAAGLSELIDALANLAITFGVLALVLIVVGWIRNRTFWRARDDQWVQGVIEAGGNVRGNFTTRLKRSWAVHSAVEKWSVVGVLVAVVQLIDGLGQRLI